MKKEDEQLHRGLEQRHINLMALGAAIGVGLFLGSATAIKVAGPAILLSYVIGGGAVFIIMRALGEMAVHNPVTGAFSRYAEDYVGPLAGYLTGWTYWFMWIVTCMTEVTAVGVYMHVWFPDIHNWIWSLVALILMGAVNFINVKLYGECEFWFALIKIVTILLMIVGGGMMIIMGVGNDGIATGISNLWTHGGFMPHGITGVLAALPIVMFAYVGVEMLGLTAGEARDPQKSLARAVNSVFWRILIFYVGALFVVMSIYPWDQMGTQGSPFVATFDKLGIPAAAGVINFVVLTAALSACNSGIFSTGRMLFNLAQQKEAPAAFAAVNRNKVPVLSLLASITLLLFGVLLDYLAPKQVFTWLTAVATFAAIWTWGVILVAHIRFRKRIPAEQLRKLPIRTPFFPLTSYITLGFLVVVVGIMTIYPDTRIALLIGPLWIIVLTIIYYLYRGRNHLEAQPSEPSVPSVPSVGTR